MVFSYPSGLWHGWIHRSHQPWLPRITRGTTGTTFLGLVGKVADGSSRFKKRIFLAYVVETPVCIYIYIYRYYHVYIIYIYIYYNYNIYIYICILHSRENWYNHSDHILKYQGDPRSTSAMSKTAKNGLSTWSLQKKIANWLTLETGNPQNMTCLEKKGQPTTSPPKRMYGIVNQCFSVCLY